MIAVLILGLAAIVSAPIIIWLKRPERRYQTIVWDLERKCWVPARPRRLR